VHESLLVEFFQVLDDERTFRGLGIQVAAWMPSSNVLLDWETDVPGISQVDRRVNRTL